MHSIAEFGAFFVFTAAAACSPSPAPKSATASAPQQAAEPTASASDPQAGTEERAELGAHFAAEALSGTIALADGDGKTVCSDVRKCTRRYLPASTFKIANAMIGLETGVVDDPESALPWDGKEYANPDWNRDHTLRSAMQASCFPCFQRIAREVGEERMRDWLGRLNYGNRDMSGGVDRFWLMGGLRISPLEQVEFLRRFARGQLPISERTADFVREIITLDVGEGHVLYGKTGSAMPPEYEIEIGWFVGFVELGPRRVYFATLIDGHGKDVELKPARRRVTERILRAQGFLP